MTDIEEFLTSLPPHLKPESATERLKMTYAFFDGHSIGLKQGLDHLNDTLLRIVPKKESA
jgi:hypothetical protein